MTEPTSWPPYTRIYGVCAGAFLAALLLTAGGVLRPGIALMGLTLAATGVVRLRSPEGRHDWLVGRSRVFDAVVLFGLAAVLVGLALTLYIPR